MGTKGGENMRCPKCGYISFDYNTACPKCNRDISSEQKKLNLPSFMPDPLPLLTALIGGGGEGQIGFGMGGMADTLRLDHLPEVSITEPENLNAKTMAEDEQEEMEIELETALGGDEEDLVVDLGLGGDSLEEVGELDIDEELLRAQEESDTRELELDTAEMVTQELDEGHDTISKESGEFDFEIELEPDKEDKE